VQWFVCTVFVVVIACFVANRWLIHFMSVMCMYMY